MFEFGVIGQVDLFKDWVNSIVLLELINEKGEIMKFRLCLDF